MTTVLNVNGVKHSVDVDDDTPLLWVIRDHIELTGTKFGCGIAMCGACTVHLDGQPIRSCLYPAVAAQGRKITTIEGINSKVAKAVQNAWQELQVPQCGYCQSGQIMAATALLESNRSPTDQEIDSAMQGNICRCATYVRIKKAIKNVAKELG